MKLTPLVEDTWDWYPDRVRWVVMGATSRAVAVVLVMGLAGPARADPCPPAALVVGDGGLVTSIESELRARGVRVEGNGGGCAVHAEVTPEARQVRVRITDADGRTTERLASDPAAAATAIESWARRDVGEPLLRGHPAAVHQGDAAVGATAPGAGPRPRRLELGAALEGGLSDDGGVWGGVHVTGCAMVGELCLGALLRYAADSELAGDTATLDNGRTALDLALVVALPIERDRLTLVPQAGLGQTSLTASRDLAEEPEREQASSLFVHAGLGLALGLTAAWSLRADAGLALAPFATPRLGEADGVDRQLAALPHARGWLGLGLAYGGL